MFELQKKPGEDFRILNFSDPQLTDTEWDGEAGAIVRGTVLRLCGEVKPDLVTLSGDLAWAGHERSYGLLADLCEQTGAPWAPIFGNHDNQEGKETLDRTVSILTSRPHCVFDPGPAELGCGNYVIAVKEGDRPVHAVFMMDTHNVKPWTKPNGETVKEWADLEPCQIEWYEKEADRLAALGYPETTVILHIPIYTYNDAFRAAFREGIDPGSVDPADGAQTGCWNEGYEDSFGVAFDGISSYREDNGFFDRVLAHGSTKTILCGHDHTTDFSILYRGVRLVFSLKVGPGCYWDERLNGGTLITVNSEGRATASHRFVDPKSLF